MLIYLQYFIMWLITLSVVILPLVLIAYGIHRILTWALEK